MMRLMLMALLLAGCTATPYVEVSGNMQHRSGASDWVLTDGAGRQRQYVGQVSAVVGIERGGWSVFAGLSHLSLPEYGHDRGLNSHMIGAAYRWRF